MNVDDITEDTIPTPTNAKDRLALIYERQRSLMHTYENIERKNRLLLTDKVPVDIHSKFGQARLKDFAWRVVEEITEATAAKVDHPDIPQHFFEEISDAFHFLIELNILADIPASAWVIDDEGLDRLEAVFSYNGYEQGELETTPYPFIEMLGRAMNTQKNKPWKQTQMLTDVPVFRSYMIAANRKFIRYCKAMGFDADSLFRIYFKKSEVNLFRQVTQY